MASEPVQTVLNRGELIALGTLAADSLTAGRSPSAGLKGLEGKRFNLVIPFGCDGPSSETSTAPLRWRYDETRQALRLNVASTAWSGGDWQIEVTGGEPPRFEGFWIARPWSTAERCPRPTGQAATTDAQPVTLPGQTLAVGELLPADPRREGAAQARRFDTVLRMPPDKLDSSQGFRLRLTGRLATLPAGTVVRCVQPAGIEQRPICLVGVTLDEVRIENPATEETLATWTGSSVRRSAP